RVVRAAVVPALENIALWHERDISHSSVERVFAPDATIALDFCLNRLAGVVDKLLVYPERMQHNLDQLGGLIHSGAVLLALTQTGMSREEAYQAVQRNATRIWQEGGNLQDALAADPEVAKRLAGTALDDLFASTAHLQHIDNIFDRALEG
ncbi:MAG: adenylosuccinate lyase, partial [Alphaproteobacteria bacterium]